jgi:hypothetical protein
MINKAVEPEIDYNLESKDIKQDVEVILYHDKEVLDIKPNTEDF